MAVTRSKVGSIDALDDQEVLRGFRLSLTSKRLCAVFCGVFLCYHFQSITSGRDSNNYNHLV